MNLHLSELFQKVTAELAKFGEEIATIYIHDKEKASEMFMKNITSARMDFFKVCDDEGVNASSFGGVLLERYFFYIIKGGITVFNKGDVMEVQNNYPLKYIRKEAGKAKMVKIDIVLKFVNSTKLYYCLELKTNFEDGFLKYYKEQTLIYHHRSNTYKPFKYHYISLSDIPKGVQVKQASQLKTLERRGQLRNLKLFNKKANETTHKEYLIGVGVKLLDALYTPMCT